MLWSAECCFRIRLSPTWTRPGGPVFLPSVRTIYLDFEAASTTWAGGTPKYAAGRLALRCIMANRDFLQAAMPDASLLGITIIFLQDKDADLDTSRVEQVRRQADDGVDVPVVEELRRIFSSAPPRNNTPCGRMIANGVDRTDHFLLADDDIVEQAFKLRRHARVDQCSDQLV